MHASTLVSAKIHVSKQCPSACTPFSAHRPISKQCMLNTCPDPCVQAVLLCSHTRACTQIHISQKCSSTCTQVSAHRAMYDQCMHNTQVYKQVHVQVMHTSTSVQIHVRSLHAKHPCVFTDPYATGASITPVLIHIQVVHAYTHVSTQIHTAMHCFSACTRSGAARQRD